MAAAVLCAALLSSGWARGGERPEGKYGYPTAPEEFHEGFVSGHVGHHTEWTAEYLTAAKLKVSVAERKGVPFFEDPDCPREWRVTLADYRGSGYDRGHRSPASDNKFSREAMRSCFSLGNMFPQEPKLNRGPWRELEMHVRDVASEPGVEVWVFTLGLFLPDEEGTIVIKTIGEHHAWVPTDCAKAVLIKRDGNLQMKGWKLPNLSKPPAFEDCEVSVDSLERDAALNLFDGLDDEIEDELESQPSTPLPNAEAEE